MESRANMAVEIGRTWRKVSPSAVGAAVPCRPHGFGRADAPVVGAVVPCRPHESGRVPLPYGRGGSPLPPARDSAV